LEKILLLTPLVLGDDYRQPLVCESIASSSFGIARCCLAKGIDLGSGAYFDAMTAQATVKTSLPRASDYTREFHKDWQRLSHSGRYDLNGLKEEMFF
jgi:hypothetical protein